MDGPLSFEEAIHRGVLAAGGPSEALARAVAVIEESLAPSGACLYSFDATAQLVAHCGGLRDAFAADMWWAEDDPCQSRAREVVEAPLVHATRLLRRRPYTRSTAYREFYGRHRIDHIVCMRLNGLRHSAPGMSGLFLSRSEDDGDFDGRHMQRLRGALPVLAALLHERARQERLRGVLDGLAGAGSIPQPLLVLAGDGELVWTSGAARALLAAAARGVVDDLLARLRQEVGASRRALVVELGAAGPWSVELSPLSSGLQLARLRPARDPEARLAERYRLTPTEAAVLACLGEGMANAEIATSLSITTATAATHVKRVLAKMGVASRLRAGLIMQREQLLD